MAEPPDWLKDLLNAKTPEEKERAWTGFLEQYSRLIIATCHKHLHWEDGAMDGYAYVIGKLRENDYARLQKYTPCKGCKFETWLVAVVKRMCVDLWRIRYHPDRTPKGRDDADSPAAREKILEQEIKKILADMLFKTLDVIVPPPTPDESPDERLVHDEARNALLECIAALPERDRLLVRLRFLDRATAAEAAGLMGFLTPWHAYRAESKVLKTLRACLEGKGITKL